MGLLFIVVFVLYSVGFILFGVAVWRSGVLPGWAGVLLAIHALLLSGPWPDPVSIVGAVLLIVVGGWIFLSTVRQPSERVMSPQAEPRVQ